MPGRHVTWYGNDTQRMRAVFIFNSLLGAYGRPGGIYLNSAPYLEAFPHPPYAVAGRAAAAPSSPARRAAELPLGPSGKARADGVRERFLRGSTAIQELIEPMITGDPYPIRGLIAYGINLLHSLPQRERTLEALQALDLVVAIDVLPQDHIAWADVVLPESTYLERHDDLWAVSHKTPYIAIREPAIEPLYDTKPGWWISRELGLRLGLDAFYGFETAEDWINTRLRSIGSSIEAVREAGGVVVQKGKPYLTDRDSSPFHTASGGSSCRRRRSPKPGSTRCPSTSRRDDPPDGFQRLLYGRHPAHTFAKTQNTPMLRALAPDNEVWVAPAAASARGIGRATSSPSETRTGIRSLPVRVKVTERIRPDAVYMVHGFGHDAPLMTGRTVSGHPTRRCRAATHSTRCAAAPACASTSCSWRRRHDSLRDGDRPRPVPRLRGLHGVVCRRERGAARHVPAAPPDDGGRPLPRSRGEHPHGAVFPLRGLAVSRRCARPGPTTRPTTASCWSTATSASAARPASCRARTACATCTPTATPTSARSATTACARGASRRASRRARPALASSAIWRTRQSELRRELGDAATVTQLRPETGTHPRVFYTNPTLGDRTGLGVAPESEWS